MEEALVHQVVFTKLGEIAYDRQLLVPKFMELRGDCLPDLTVDGILRRLSAYERFLKRIPPTLTDAQIEHVMRVDKMVHDLVYKDLTGVM